MLGQCGSWLACDGWVSGARDVWSDGVHIRYLGDGWYWFRPYGGSLLRSAKVSKTLLPHHSVPRLGSACPLSGLNPWAAATRHPWRGAANPASCRVTHGFKPAFGQRGLTGRLRSKADQDQKQSNSRATAEQQQSNSGLCAGASPLSKAAARSARVASGCGSIPRASRVAAVR